MSTEPQPLEEQRDALLKSLRDLEQERAAGEIGDDDYARLKDDYTVRAAAVIRAIEAKRSSGSSPSRRSAGGGGGAGRPRTRGPRRAGDRPAVRRGAVPAVPAVPAIRPGRRQRTLAISLLVGFALAAVAGLTVVLTAGGRDPGQPATGTVGGGSSDPDAPNRVDDALALETEGQPVEALKLYDEILLEEPDNVEALAYRGWLLKRAGLADEALESLNRAVVVDPTFADAHFFRGMVLYQDKDDPAGAVLEFEAFLDNDPPPEFVLAVREVLAKAEAAAAAKAAGIPPSTTTPAGAG